MEKGGRAKVRSSDFHGPVMGKIVEMVYSENGRGRLAVGVDLDVSGGCHRGYY